MGLADEGGVVAVDDLADEEDPDATLPAPGDEAVEVRVVAETGVDTVVVQGVVAVGCGVEHGTEQQSVAAEADQVVQPRLELSRATLGDVAAAVFGGSERSHREHLPPDGVAQIGRGGASRRGTSSLARRVQSCSASRCWVCAS